MIGGTQSAPTMSIPNAAASATTTAVKNGSRAENNGTPGTTGVLATIFTFVGLYLIWALVQQHQRVKQQLQPQNITANLHNLFSVFMMVVVAMVLFKTLLAKLIGWGLSFLKPVATVVNMA